MDGGRNAELESKRSFVEPWTEFLFTSGGIFGKNATDQLSTTILNKRLMQRT